MFSWRAAPLEREVLTRYLRKNSIISGILLGKMHRYLWTADAARIAQAENVRNFLHLTENESRVCGKELCIE